MAKRGQPTKYDDAYCDELFEYFDKEPYETIADVKVPVDLPLFSGFARQIGVHRATLHEWKKTHVEFADAWAMAKECQEHILVTNGLLGLYDRSFAIFTSKNTIGFRDTQPEDTAPTVIPPPQLTPEQFDEYVERQIAARKRK